MTKNQKIILIVLGVVNILCFCVIAPIFLFTSGASNSPVAAPTSATRTSLELRPTSTPAGTETPAPTNTLVLRPRPTVYRATITPRALELGWKFYEVTDDGYALALPETWDRIDFNRDRLAEMFKTLNDKNPQFASTLSSQTAQLAALDVKFFGLDLSSDALSSGFVTNVNVLRQPLTISVPLDTYAQLSVQNLQKSASVTKPARKRITIPAGDAEVIQYQLTLTTSKGKTTTSTTQYLMIHSNSGYIVTFTTRPDKEKIYASIFQKIAQSVQWVQ